jgi:hypothetical protein
MRFLDSLQRLGVGIMNVTKDFISSVFNSSKDNAAVFESFDSRITRYAMQWAFYEGKQYDQSAINTWLQGYKVARGLYKYVRNIYNPVLRLGDFWTQTIWRGSIDVDAGNKGAIPIGITSKKVDETALRLVIATIMRVSNWNVNKDIHVLHGTILGDAAIYIRDDQDRRQSRLEVIHPRQLVEVITDDMGFVKAYKIEYLRIDNENRSSLYCETCEHGEAENEIVFKTYRDGKLYAWAGNVDAKGSPVSQWSMFYGFVPLVVSQHKNVGLDWGLCEFHADIDKISEVNDGASLLNDQIRKTINVKWLANWAKGTVTNAAQRIIQSVNPTIDKPQPGREDENMIYVDRADVKAQALVAPLAIDHVLMNIDKMLEELENDLPELKSEVWAGGSGPSDSTILAARGRVEGKAQKRRANYDTGFVRAVQMAITISALGGYDGFETYTIDSYKNGELDFSISDRPLFPPQPSEIMQAKQTFWDGWAKLANSGVAFKTYARDYGWTDEQIEQAVLDMQELTGEMIPTGGQ